MVSSGGSGGRIVELCCLTGMRASQPCVGCADGLQAAPEVTRPMQQVSGLRYGENPHQPAAFYSDLSLAEDGKGGIATAVLHHGKEVHPVGPLATPGCCRCCLFCRVQAHRQLQPAIPLQLVSRKLFVVLHWQGLGCMCCFVCICIGSTT